MFYGHMKSLGYKARHTLFYNSLHHFRFNLFISLCPGNVPPAFISIESEHTVWAMRVTDVFYVHSHTIFAKIPNVLMYKVIPSFYIWNISYCKCINWQ